MKDLILIALLVLAACDAKPSNTSPRQTTTNAEPPATGALTDVGTADAETDSKAELAQPEEPLKIEPPLQVASVDLEAFKDQKIGTITGPLYGDNATIRAIGRVECGQGVLLQPVFEQPKGLMISPPIPLPLFNLKTREAVEFDQGDFRVHAHFDSDTSERLKGTLKITVPGANGRQTYVDMTVDGKPFEAQIPSKMPNEGVRPGFPRCVPSGYFIVKEGDHVARGLVRVDDAANRGVPLVSLFLTPHHMISLLLIPRDKGMQFKDEISFDLGGEENPDAKLVAKIIYTGSLKPDVDATWKNVDIAREATLLDGKISATLVKEKKLWRLKMTLDDIKIPRGIDGLEGRTLDEIKIDAFLAKDETLKAELPDAPTWFESAK